MGGHIRMDKDLADDPRVAELTRQQLEVWHEYGLPRDLPPQARAAFTEAARCAVLGGLYRLWRHTDTYASRNRIRTASQAISDVTGIPVTLLQRFPRDWYVEHPDGTIELPDYSEKNALLDKAERREKARERTRRWRARKRAKGPHKRVTVSDKESVVKPVTTGTGTGTTVTRTGPGGSEGATSGESGDALARAIGPLARREPNGKNGKHPPKSPAELEGAARELARSGFSIEDITRSLRGYQVTSEQVRTWIETLQPPTVGSS
jgi:hypothetical protein